MQVEGGRTPMDHMRNTEEQLRSLSYSVPSISQLSALLPTDPSLNAWEKQDSLRNLGEHLGSSPSLFDLPQIKKLTLLDITNEMNNVKESTQENAGPFPSLLNLS